MARALWNPQLALRSAGLPESLVPISIACKVTGYNQATVRQWVRDGKVQAWGVPWTNRYLIDLRDIIQPIQSQGKPSGRKYRPSVETREKMRDAQIRRFARHRELKALEAQQLALQASTPHLNPTDPEQS